MPLINSIGDTTKLVFKFYYISIFILLFHETFHTEIPRCRKFKTIKMIRKYSQLRHFLLSFKQYSLMINNKKIFGFFFLGNLMIDHTV